MNPVRLTVVFLAFVSGLSGSAQATTIHDFGRMNNDDDATFVTLLITNAADFLKAHGQPDQAHKVIAFFKDPSNAGGVHQFAEHVKEFSSLNTKNSENPNNRVPVYQVEDAMALTLKDEGFNIPVSYLLNVGNSFHPVGPPRSLITGQ
jgi:hypothetical protein